MNPASTDSENLEVADKSPGGTWLPGAFRF
jgi:hypothetical protein